MEANKAADTKNLGVALGRMCIKADVSVSQVAAMFDVSRQTVYNWFAGHYTPNQRIVETIKAYIDDLKHRSK
jgi:DNA-binding XRE family transcriptional regulator